MKFLAKREDSRVVSEGLRYKKRDSTRLRNLLLIEQKGFCAYSEKYVSSIDTTAVEHFDSSLKNTDADVVEADDNEAIAFIDYMNFNRYELYEERRRHVERLQDLFEDAGWSEQKQLEWFERHPEELSFITALEACLGLDLVPLLT